MKIKPLFYWVSTLILAAFMAFVAFAYLAHQAKISASFSSLGYPPYFQNILGVAKLLGAAALLIPAFPRLREWAYAGFTFTFIGAFFSHLAMHQNGEAIMPLLTLIILAVSYSTRPTGGHPASVNPFVLANNNLEHMTTPQLPHLEPLKFSTVPGDRPRIRTPKLHHSSPAGA